MIKLCGLWANKDKNGDVYFQGKLGYGARVMIFKNAYATGERSPDWILYIAEDKKQGGQEGQEKPAWNKNDYVITSPYGPDKASEGDEPEGEDEVPF